MTDEHSGKPAADDGVTPDQPDDMLEADVANGGEPDEVDPDRRARASGGHRTGERQAAENRSDDPPA